MKYISLAVNTVLLTLYCIVLLFAIYHYPWGTLCLRC